MFLFNVMGSNFFRGGAEGVRDARVAPGCLKFRADPVSLFFSEKGFHVDMEYTFQRAN